MGTQDIVITGAGLVSPIGLSLPEAAAAARAKVARLAEIAWLDRRSEPFVVGRVPDEALPALNAELDGARLQPREARLLQLAQVALDETVATDPGARAPLPLLLGLPEHHTARALDAPAFLAHLAQQWPGRIDLARSLAAPRGRAAGLLALREACARLRRGEASHVLVGGVDSLIDPWVLGTLDAEGRVRNSVNSDGFSPSEGAAFLLLCTAGTAHAAGVQPLVRLLGAAQGQEAGHLYADEPYRGEGLAQTLQALLAAAAPPAPIASVYTSFNGERYWAREFGVARLRQHQAFEPDHTMEHPADCFGDLGSAHGPALAALAAHGLRHGYRASPCLVLASSDRGERAAALMASP